MITIPRLPALPLFALFLVASVASASDDFVPPQSGVVKGILFNFSAASAEIMPDGLALKQRYTISDHLLPDSDMPGKQIFPDNRVQFQLEKHGDDYQCVSIKKIPCQTDGAVTGQIVWTDGWAVVVKPLDGPADGFGQGGATTKATLELMKTLKSGDYITVNFTSDFERHRIQSIEKIPPPEGEVAALQWRQAAITGQVGHSGDSKAILTSYFAQQDAVAALLDDRPTLMFIVVNAPADADADGGAPSRHVVDGAAVEKSAFSFPVASLVPAAAPYLWSRDGAAAANTVPLVKPDWQFSRIRLPRRIHGTAFT